MRAIGARLLVFTRAGVEREREREKKSRNFFREYLYIVAIWSVTPDAARDGPSLFVAEIEGGGVGGEKNVVLRLRETERVGEVETLIRHDCVLCASGVSI